MTQTLKLADDLIPGLLSGERTNTIRKGRRDIVPGPLVLESVSGAWRILVNVESVAVAPASCLSIADVQANGYADHWRMIEGMREFYPDFDEDTMCTVVRWSPAIAVRSAA